MALFFSFTTPEIVLNELKIFNLNKANCPNRIPVKILKDMKCEISVPLSALTNLLFDTGIFPIYLKLARIIPIFNRIVITIDQFLFYQTLGNYLRNFYIIDFTSFWTKTNVSITINLASEIIILLIMH